MSKEIKLRQPKLLVTHVPRRYHDEKVLCSSSLYQLKQFVPEEPIVDNPELFGFLYPMYVSKKGTNSRLFSGDRP